ncbi:MAG: hypothetical protein HYR63_00350 [Proteobacteria bacterium]|nr:hypothetical protein [Pseudomonadota bacterium]
MKTLVAEGWRRGLDMVFMPQADPVYCRLGPDNAFWILGVDLDGRVATTQGGRLYDWTGSNMKREVESLRFFYDRPEDHTDEGCWCEMPEAARQITGTAVHSGSMWVRPDLRGPSEDGIVLSQLLGKLTRALGVALWNAAYVFTFSSLELNRRGVVANFGYDHYETPLRLKLPERPLYEAGLCWMTARSFVDWAATWTPEDFMQQEARRRARI